MNGVLNIYEEEFIEILKGNRKEYIKKKFKISIYGEGQDTIVISKALIHFVNCARENIKVISNYPIFIENCQFLSFLGLSIECSDIIFKQCSFFEHLSIWNVKSANFSIIECQVNMQTTISNCKIQILNFDSKFGLIKFNDNEFNSFILSGKYKEIEISRCIFQGEFSLLNCEEIGKLMIGDSSFLLFFNLKNSKFEDRAIFQKNTFEENAIITESKFGWFYIESCEFRKSLTLINNEVVNDFSLTNSSIKDELNINRGEYHKEIILDTGIFKNLIFKEGIFSRILFRSGTFDGFIKIKGGKYNDITFKGGTYTRYIELWERKETNVETDFTINKINISGGDFKENFWIKDGKINEININPLLMSRIHILPSNDNKYVFSNPIIKTLNIKNYFYKDSFLQISDISIEKLSFTNFTNIATITIANVKIEKELEIINSDLGKTTFIDCDFSNIRFKFKSSKITETSLNGTPLPTDIIAEDNIQKRLALSQIKRIYENRGDVVEANKYFAKEMNTHLLTLSWIDNFWEKSNVWLNKISSNHSQNLRRSFISTFIVSILCFTFYCRSLGYELSIPANTENMDTYLELRSYLLEFMNPIHKADYIPNELDKYELRKENLKIQETKNKPEIPRDTRFWDVFSRIVIGYFIYQLIAAFRKHGKKS